MKYSHGVGLATASLSQADSDVLLSFMRFFLGDDNGQLKVANCASSATEWKVDVSVLDKCSKSEREKAIQKLAVYHYDRVMCPRKKMLFGSLIYRLRFR